MNENVTAEMRGVVGARQLGAGALSTVRLTSDASVGMAQTAARFAELTMTGRVFSLFLSAWTSTVAAGNIVGAAAAASTQFALWNPSGSGFNLQLLKFGVWFVSGTSPVPPVSHSYSSTAPTIANAAVTPVANNKVGGPTSCAAGYLSSAAGAALTGSSILKYIRVADLFVTAGTAAQLGGQRAIEYIEGDIVLTPGTCWVPTWAAAGTTFLGGYSITWYEAPV